MMIEVVSLYMYLEIHIIFENTIDQRNISNLG